MTLAPVWRTRLYTIGGAVLAIWMGFAIAQEQFLWPLLFLGGIAVLLLIQLQPLSIGTVLLGALLLGNIVGNRGFAQLYVSSSLPLLPAELVLLVAGAIFAIQSAFRHELPWRRDALNYTLLLWMMIGTARLFFDLKPHGFAALRDYAVVYYGAFFFLAQSLARHQPDQRFLIRCLLGGTALLLVTQELYRLFPDFFLSVFTVRGIPLVYYKGDLVGIFMAMGALLFFWRFEERRRWWHLVISLALIAATLASNNRASMLGLGVATLLLAVCGQWRFAAIQLATGTVAALVILLAAHLTSISWEKTPLFGIYERVVSVTDPFGNRNYSSEDAFDKGDNNRFRAVWWRTVIDETLEGNPYTGLGFGHDLAGRFVQEYYPEDNEEFSTRSPHNVLLTIFARMGLAGLLPFLAAAGLMGLRTFRSIRAGPSENAMLWCGIWIILVSACLGVVLEGPMGAVVFWTVLGLANASLSAQPAAAGEEPAVENEAEALHAVAEKV